MELATAFFFAPLFLILGVLARRFAKKPASPHRYSYLLISLICLLLESYLLHHFTTPKHDSMYVFLPFVLLFLFPIIQQWQAPIIWKQAGRLSLWLYLLHPYTIAVTHFLSQKLPFAAKQSDQFLRGLRTDHWGGARSLCFCKSCSRFRKKRRPNCSEQPKNFPPPLCCTTCRKSSD